MKKEQLKRKAIYGFVWSFTELVSNQGLQLVIQIFLARLLLPEHFGLIGMITIFVALSTSLVHSGMDQALIRESKPSQLDLSTVFHFNLMSSILIYLILFFSAPAISSFFNEPELINIIRVLMLVVVINALSVIQRVILIREIDFKTQTKVSIYAGVLSGIIAISLAWSGFGVWSLVAQTLIMQMLQTILLFIHNRWLPSLLFSVNSFKYFFNFGYKLLLSGLVDTVYRNIYFVIIGKLYPVTLLGYYTNASRLRDASSHSITQAIQKVTYPVLSQMKDDESRLSVNYQKVIRMSGFLIFPTMLGVAAIAPNFIPFLLGEKWKPSVIYFQMLSIAAMLYPIHSINLNILKVKGRSDLFLRLEIIKKGILTVLLTLAVLSKTGIEGLIGAAIANSYISLFINMYYSGTEINYSYSKQIMDLLPSFLSAIMMGVLVYLSNSVLSGIYFVDIMIQIIIGVILYAMFSFLFKIKELKEIMNFIKSKI